MDDNKIEKAENRIEQSDNLGNSGGMTNQNDDAITKKEKTGKKGLIIGIIVAAVIILSLIAGIVVTKVIPGQRVKSLLSLGDKYLSELKYEDAIAAYEAAIEIEPKTEAAYIGIANAYIGLGDYEKALDAVERGIQAVGETEELLDLKAHIEDLIKQQQKEETETLAAEEEAKRKAEAENWTFDLYDILQYNLFGKDVAEWTQEEFLSYIEDNGYAFSDSDEPQYAAGPKSGGVSFCGGEIEIEYGSPFIWSVSKRSFSPEVEAQGMVLHYDFPSLNPITETEFLERLPLKIAEALEGNNRSAAFSDGRCYRREGEMNTWCVFYDDETSPTEPMRLYVFLVNNQEYHLGFNSDTGELLEISETEPSTTTGESLDGASASEIPGQDFNDMAYVMDGCDFRRSKWGDTVEDVSQTEPVWNQYEEAPDQATFDGEKVYMRVFSSRFGSYGRTVCYYHFDEEGKLYKGEFATAFDGTRGIDEAAEEIYGMIKDKLGRDAIDNKYINCDPDTFDEDLASGNAMRLSGWELDDGTMLIESVMPFGEPMNIIVVGYYDVKSEHSTEGIAGIAYDFWQQFSN